MAASKDMPPLKNFGSVFWRNQFRTKIDLPDPAKLTSSQGKVAIVTGANTGLGYEAARQLLTLGMSHLVIGVRSLEKGKAAALALQPANSTAKIDVWLLDMELYDSISAFVRRCDTELARIDYTILNAGLSRTTFSKTKSTGHETTMQVNHFGTALLTVLLLPIIKSKADRNDSPPRMTIVNSLTAHLCKFPNRQERPLLNSFDDTTAVPWDAQERYGVSKLINQLFVVKLADCVNADDVTINMVDPGLTKGTKLSRDASGLIRIGANLFFSVCGRPLDRGAATYIYALMEVGTESHGCFLMSNKISP
jgi:NAD(P)-dependent dehydrogenase (short-subunit alcohol dehydrogenase family)